MKLQRLQTLFLGCLVLLVTSCSKVEPQMADMVVPEQSPAPVASADVTSPRDLSSPPIMGDGTSPVAQADTSDAEKGDKEVKEEEEIKRDYSKVLKDPSELGFEPTDALFRNVYYYIKKSFVEDVPETRLFEGVKSEVRDLLDQAEIPADELDTLDPGKKVLPQLKSRFGDKIDEDLLTFAAILGMLDGLEDRYSLLMLPKDYEKLQEQMQNTEFGGIGIYIELDRDDENRLTVFEPIEGTPAFQAGLMAGDKVMKIDGETTDGITLEQAQSRIRGPKGSKVILTISRKGEAEKDYPVVRGNIHVVSVSSKMLDDKVGYVRLRLFGQQTADEMRKAIEKLKSKGATSLVLDLRNNGGGYVDAAVDVVSQFLQKDNGLVVYTVDRNNRRREYRAAESGTVDIPTIVMVNEFSASASEITAGALRDHGLAQLIGVKSFGKGSVQQLYPFADGSALKLTIAKFYTPKGSVINKQGLEPDFEVEMEPRYVGRGEKDSQLKKAVELLKTRKLSKDVNGTKS